MISHFEPGRDSELMGDKLKQAVLKILAMTHEGRLQWSRRAGQAWYPVGSANPEYEAQCAGRTLLLSVGGLVLLGREGAASFEFPLCRVVQDMYSAVRYKDGNVDNFITGLLGT